MTRKEVYNAFIALCVMIALSLVVSLFKVVQNANEAPITASINDTTIVSRMYNVFSTLDSIGNNTISDEKVREVLVWCGVQHPHIIYAQMRLESANFTSVLCKSNNNYFGMKDAYKRPTFSIGAKNGYATYRNWVYSILDYAMWQKHYANDLSEEEYLNRLKTYATDKNYIEKVKKIAKSF